MFEGVLIVVAAIAILHAAYRGFMAPNVLAAPIEGLAVNGAASAINAVWCLVLFRYGQKWRSPALVADAQHLWTDVVRKCRVSNSIHLVAAPPDILYIRRLARVQGSESGVAGSDGSRHQQHCGSGDQEIAGGSDPVHR